MLIKEMVDLFKTLFQQEASNRTGKWNDDQTVVALNVGQSRVFDSLLTNGMTPDKRPFETSQRREDWLRNLSVKNVKLTPLKPTEDAYNSEPTPVVYCNLPFDYIQLTNHRSVVQYLSSGCSDSIEGNDATIKEFVGTVPFSAIQESICNPEFDFKLRLLDYLDNGSRADRIIFDINDYIPSTELGDYSKEAIINIVLDTINRSNNKVENPNLFAGNLEQNNRNVEYIAYWEKYRDQYYRDHFIIVTRDPNKVHSSTSVSVDNPFVTSTGLNYIKSATNTNMTLEGHGLSNIDKIVISDGTNTDEITTGITASEGSVIFNYNPSIENNNIVPKALTIKLYVAGAPDTLYVTIDGFFMVKVDSTLSDPRGYAIINESYEGIYLNIDTNSSVTTTKATVDAYFVANPTHTVGDYNINESNEYSKLGKFQEVVYYKTQMNVNYGNGKTLEAYKPNNLVEGSSLYNALNSEYRKPTRERPVANISGNYLYLYTNGKFIINDVYIDYKKIPVELSLEQNISPEWGDNRLHRWIVEEAVRFAEVANSGDRIGILSQEKTFNR